MITSLNQQFAWCDLLLSQWGEDTLPWRREALRQSLSWHLQIAYCALLRDMGAAARLPLAAPVTSVNQLIAQVPAGRNCPQEWRELAALEADVSWLSTLLSQPSSPVQQIQSGSVQTPGLIASSQAQTFDLETCKQILAALKAFTERWRALEQEW